MQIKDLSRATGVDVETIRYYEKQGLLPKPARRDNGYRDYAAQHLERLSFIRHGHRRWACGRCGLSMCRQRHQHSQRNGAQSLDRDSGEAFVVD